MYSYCYVYVFLLLCLCILTVMFMNSYCHICSVLGTLFNCVVLCTVCVQMCTVLMPPGVKPIAVNKYIVITYHIISIAMVYFVPHTNVTPMGRGRI